MIAHDKRAQIYIELAEQQVETGKSPAQATEKIRDAAEKALAVYPHYACALTCKRALNSLLMAEYALLAGTPVNDSLASVTVDVQSAVACAPDSLEAALYPSRLAMLKAVDLLQRGGDLKQWLDPQRILDYAMNNTSDVELLPQSIDLEVFKIFHFEPRAFALDYANGETALEVPFLGIVNVRVECHSREEFVHHRVANYVEGFENMFIERYPAQKERIRAEFERAVDKYGAALLGSSPYHRVKMINDSVVSKMKDSMGGARWPRE